MSESFLELGGVTVPVDGLAIPRARALADVALHAVLDHVRFVGCERLGGAGTDAREAVVLDLDVERGQITAHDIRHAERVVAVFGVADDSSPEVLALRPDFPDDVPHLNLRAEEGPRSLCLYERPWPEVRLRWTPASFIERVREWLSLTARGELHQGDQPLEPMLFGGGFQLILPPDLFRDRVEAHLERLDVAFAQQGEGCRVLVARRPGDSPTALPAAPFVLTSFVAREQTHGRIRRAPSTIEELHGFLASAGIDLLGELRTRIRSWPAAAAVRGAKLIIAVAFPLRRETGDEVEAVDLWAFCCPQNVLDVGVAVGVLDRAPGGQPAMLLTPDESKRGADSPLETIRPLFDFSRELAAKASGQPERPLEAVAVGVGALGSQVVQTLYRGGFGRWTLVDDDDLLPHNIARHGLGPDAVGGPKAQGLASLLDGLYREGEGTRAVHANVLAPGSERTRLDKALTAAEVIFDMAASVPVSRYLSIDVAGGARRVSLFFNPTGTDLVLLAEDAARTRRLDALEMQYYRAAATQDALQGHFRMADRIRYARSCGDVSAVLPAHLVSLLSAIAAGAAQQACAGSDADIRIWRSNPETLGVECVRVPSRVTHRHRVGDWQLVFDDVLLAKLHRLRAGALPKETGGVLMGAYDFQRKIVYVVDSLPSPPDSHESPDQYSRGHRGLTSEVAAYTARTHGQLEYIGEWHSHPDHALCAPSELDVALFRWLGDRLAPSGQPPLMAIVCSGGSAWFLDGLETTHQANASEPIQGV